MAVKLAEVGVDGDDTTVISTSGGHDVGVWCAKETQFAHVDGVIASGGQQGRDAR